MKWIFFLLVIIILAAILYSIEEELSSPDFLWKIRRAKIQIKNKIKKRK
jgi:CDP-diacylglycerol pyrophosphatase